VFPVSERQVLSRVVFVLISYAEVYAANILAQDANVGFSTIIVFAEFGFLLNVFAKLWRSYFVALEISRVFSVKFNDELVNFVDFIIMIRVAILEPITAFLPTFFTVSYEQ
jgi:hypothetical protein